MPAEVTLLLNTCRPDFPLVGLPDMFIFEPTVRSLNRQAFRDFELVVVDAKWSERRRKWLEEHAEFPVKYLNAFPNRYLEAGLCAICTQKNKGLLYAEGDLVVFIDDATEFPPWWLARIWHHWSRGYWPMSLTYYYEGGRPKILGQSSRYVERFYGREHDKEEGFRLYIRPGEQVRDSRADFVSGVRPAPGQWFYAGSSAPLEVLLDVNGLDESFDGSKGLEDVDLGMRLELWAKRHSYTCGGLPPFLLDRDLWHIEHWHGPIAEDVLFYRGPTPKCNFGLLQLNQLEGRWRANERVLTRERCVWVRENICPKCPNRPRCLNEEFRARFFIECEGFEVWLKLQRARDLREERKRVEWP